MAFSFFGFLRKDRAPQEGAPAQPQEKRQVPAKDIPKLIRSEFSSRMDDEREKFSSFSRDILPHVDSFRGNVEAVRDKQFGRGESYYAAVNMIKDTWAKKTLMGISSYQADFRKVPEGADFAYYSGLYRETLKLMNETGVAPKQQIVLKKFFEDESARLSETLKILSQSMDGLGGLIRGGGALRAESGAASLLKELAEIESGAAGIREKISSLSAEEGRKGSEISELEAHHDKVSRSPEWKEMETIQKEREVSIRERDGIEAEISSRMGGLKRPLKLFAHEAPDLSKDEQRLAEGMSHSPAKAILSQEPQAVEKLLSKALHEGRKMGLPEKDATRLGAIEGIVSTGWLKDASARHAALSKHIEECWERMKAIDIASKKVHAGRLVEKSMMELAAITKQKQALAAKLSEEEKRIKEKKKEISELLKKELSLEVEAQ